MKVQRIIEGRSIRLLEISGPEGGSIYGGNLARACEERYGFLESPKTLDDFNLEKGITFRHGAYNGLLIERFQFYSNGLLASAQINTDICDAFLNDVIAWATQRGGVKFGDKQQKLYVSTLEFSSQLDLQNIFQPIQKIAEKLSFLVSSRSGSATEYEFNAFHLKQSIQNSPIFSLEKILTSPGDDSVFFSTSPLNTDDHINFLDDIEHNVMLI